MEIELGLKITKTRHDITSISDFHFSKDRGGPVFLSKQTLSKFILYAHLKGYTGENVEIKISEDGEEIWVSGERAVQEMTMMPLRMKEEEVKMRGFRRKFKIPEGVVLDWIKARYDEDGCVLTIVMPKMVRGVNRGIGIEELKEEEKKEEVDAIEEKAEATEQSVAEEVREEVTEQSVAEEVKEEEKEDNIAEEADQKSVVEEKKEEEKEEEVDGRENVAEEADQRSVEEVKEKEEEKEEGEEQSVGDEVSQKTHEEEETRQEVTEDREPWKPSPPLLVGGSTLLATLLYLAINYLRLRKD